MTRSLFALVVLLAACGPSSAEIKQAKTARYTCDYDKVFKTVMEVVKEETPPLRFGDQERGLVYSTPRWHSPSGMRKKPGAGDFAAEDLSFYVEVHVGKDGAGFHVLVVPHITSQVSGSPRGREMTHDDANWPPWADGKADKVSLSIHEKLSGCAAKGP